MTDPFHQLLQSQILKMQEENTRANDALNAQLETFRSKLSMPLSPQSVTPPDTDWEKTTDPDTRLLLLSSSKWLQRVLQAAAHDETFRKRVEIDAAAVLAALNPQPPQPQ